MSKESTIVADPLAESHQRFISAVLAGDVAAISSLYTDTSVLMPPNDPTLYGRRELEEWHHEYFADFRVVNFTEVEREVSIFENWAVERWAYMVAIQPLSGGDRIRDDGRFLALWKREDGVWRISQAMFNSIRPVGSATTRFFVRLKNRSSRSQQDLTP